MGEGGLLGQELWELELISEIETGLPSGTV